LSLIGIFNKGWFPIEFKKYYITLGPKFLRNDQIELVFLPFSKTANGMHGLNENTLFFIIVAQNSDNRDKHHWCSAQGSQI